MKVDYYSIIKRNSEFPPKTLISFIDEDKAVKHLEILNRDNLKEYSLIRMEADIVIGGNK